MEIEVIYIVVAFIIIYLIEAKHDFIIAKKEKLIQLLANKEERKSQKELSDDWHRLDWFYLLFVAILISLLFDGTIIEKITILVVISTMKIIIFNPVLNKFLGNDLFYLGSGFIEDKFKGKEMFYYGTAFLLFVTSLIFLWWNTKG